MSNFLNEDLDSINPLYLKDEEIITWIISAEISFYDQINLLDVIH